MNKILIFFLTLYFNFTHAANRPYLPSDLKIELDQAQVSEVVRFVYLEAYKQKPFYLAPEILEDKRIVSFRFNSEFSKFDPFFNAFLDQLGFERRTVSNTDLILKKQVRLEKELDNLELPPSLDPNIEIFIYEPKFRPSTYLVNNLHQLFKGKFTQQGGVSAPQNSSFDKVDTSNQSSGSALSNVRLNSKLIFYGQNTEVKILKQLLEKIDTKVDEVLVSAVIYEVGTDKQNQSAISILGSILKNSLAFSIGAGLQADSFIKLTSSTGLSGLIQLLNNDSRFSVLSNPSLRAVSGKSSTLTIGEDVPVLGSVVQSQGQAPVQSVEYRPSGLIFDLTPNVFGNVIGIHVSQELSTFTNTKTGVNNTPTLIKRKIESDVQAEDGELIVLGGLKSNRKSKGVNSIPLGFGNTFTVGTSNSASESEILILLELKKI